MTVWSAAVVADLTRLWGEGVTAEEIGRRLGLTKSTVLGKAHRLDLAPRRVRKRKHLPSSGEPHPWAPAQKSVAPKPGREASTAEAIAPAAQTAAGEIDPLRLRAPGLQGASPPARDPGLQGASPPARDWGTRPATPEEYAARGLSRRTCLWPSGDPREPGYGVCGARAVIGKPYCPDHCAAAYLIPRSTLIRTAEDADAPPPAFEGQESGQQADASSADGSPVRLHRREPAARASRDADASVASDADASRPQGL